MTVAADRVGNYPDRTPIYFGGNKREPADHQPATQCQLDALEDAGYYIEPADTFEAQAILARIELEERGGLWLT
jgi:hypothetical protein